MATPAIVKILSVFAAILALNRLRVPLGAALILGGIGLSAWAGVPMPETTLNLGRSLISPEMWLTLTIMTIIVEIARFMTEGRNAQEILSAAKRWGGRRGHAYSVMTLPAVVGLVPMPAGAIFSAPLVEEAGSGAAAPNVWKSAVNYWFRHIWEYWWPLYPGVMMALAVFEIDYRRFLAAQFLFTPVSVAAGYLFLIRRHIPRLAAVSQSSEGSNRRAVVLMLPLLAVIISLFVFSPVLTRMLPAVPDHDRKLLSVLLGLVASTVLIFFVEDNRRLMFSSIATRKSAAIFGTLVGVLVFKSMLDKSGLLPDAAEEMLRTGIPPAAAVAGLPLLAGLVTGVAVGFTGVSFPLVVGLMGQPASGLTPLATLVLAYGFGYTGMMLSPVHLCLLVTREYFAVPLRSIYATILPCCAVLLAYSLAAHAVLAALGL